MFAGSTHHRQADPPGEEHWQGALWRGMEGQMAWGEHRCQDLLHHGGGELVQGNRTLPDSPAEARKHSRWVKYSLLPSGGYWVKQSEPPDDHCGINEIVVQC